MTRGVREETFLDQKRREIQERMAVLKPAVDEHERLTEADKMLGGLPPSFKRRGRPPGSGRKAK